MKNKHALNYAGRDSLRFRLERERGQSDLLLFFECLREFRNVDFWRICANCHLGRWRIGILAHLQDMTYFTALIECKN